VTAAADGYTLLLATVPNAVNASLYEKLNFNFIRDIAPVAGIIGVPMIILLHPSVPVKTVPEFIAYARKNPGKVNMASAGNGSAPHMAGELFKMMAGIDLVHVPYRGQFQSGKLQLNQWHAISCVLICVTWRGVLMQRPRVSGAR
jgi:tripartite-type tricarboxylate transporter receptor subunit TctC